MAGLDAKFAAGNEEKRKAEERRKKVFTVETGGENDVVNTQPDSGYLDSPYRISQMRIFSTNSVQLAGFDVILLQLYLKGICKEGSSTAMIPKVGISLITLR